LLGSNVGLLGASSSAWIPTTTTTTTNEHV